MTGHELFEVFELWRSGKVYNRTCIKFFIHMLTDDEWARWATSDMEGTAYELLRENQHGFGSMQSAWFFQVAKIINDRSKEDESISNDDREDGGEAGHKQREAAGVKVTEPSEQHDVSRVVRAKFMHWVLDRSVHVVSEDCRALQ